MSLEPKPLIERVLTTKVIAPNQEFMNVFKRLQATILKSGLQEYTLEEFSSTALEEFANRSLTKKIKKGKVELL